MNEKNRDHKGRWRNKTLAVHVSPEEMEQIDEIVALSGLTKQDYVLSRVMDRNVIVQKSPRTYKALKCKMELIYAELCRLEHSSDCSEEFLETIRYVSAIYGRLSEDQKSTDSGLYEEK